MGNVPECSKCGKPSPYGNPCEACIDVEVEAILRMSDDEILADMKAEGVTPDQVLSRGKTLIARATNRALADCLRDLMKAWPEGHLPPHDVTVRCANILNVVSKQ